MSEILVNKLTGTSTAGSILVTGEGNSTTTNLQQGLAKSWANGNGDSTAAIQNSFNNASITDNGTGDYTFGFTNNTSNANNCTVGEGENGGSGNRIYSSLNNGGQTSSCRIAFYNEGGNVFDSTTINYVNHGDLA